MKITKSCERILPRVSADYVQKLFFYENEFQHFCIFYLEYLLITSAFLHILPRISAHFIHKILKSRNSVWETRVLRHPSGRKSRNFLRETFISKIQNIYPNPFNPTTSLRFDLPEVSSITLTIYNMLGQKIKTFNMNSISAGSHSIKWNATNDLGYPVGAGVYLYQLQTKY